MSLELFIVILYLLGCIAIGILASRKVLGSSEEYWVAGRRVGTWVNAVAIMATLATLVFVFYVAFGGMIAITWTDVMQGALMFIVVIGAALAMTARTGSPMELMQQATTVAPELGQVAQQPVTSYLGSFVLWAAAIPVIPHIVMRVFTAKDAHSARLSLNIAMVIYSVMILAGVLAIVPVGKMLFPDLVVEACELSGRPSFVDCGRRNLSRGTIHTRHASALGNSLRIARERSGHVARRPLRPGKPRGDSCQHHEITSIKRQNADFEETALIKADSLCFIYPIFNPRCFSGICVQNKAARRF